MDALYRLLNSWLKRPQPRSIRRASAPSTPALVQILESRVCLSAATPELAVPQTVYGVVGESTTILFENLVPTLNTVGLRFEVNCNVGTSTASAWTVIPQSTDIGDHSWQISVWQGDTLLDSQSCVFRVTANIASERDENLLLVGDSLTQASHYASDLADQFVAEGREVTFLGTHHPTDSAPNVFHEGYGGWTWNRFLTQYEPNPNPGLGKRSSPFVFLENGVATLDVPRYLQDSLGGTKPDYVTFLLGINDCIFLDASRPDQVDQQIDIVLTSAESLIAAFRAASPDTEIGICLTPPPNGRESAFTENYAGRYTRDNWKPVQHRLVERLIERFEDRECENIFVVPTGLNMSPMESYAANNAVHPNERGYSEIAASIRGWLLSRMQPQQPILKETTFVLDENATVNSVVGQLSLENPMAGRSPVYAIAGGASATAFAIDAATGELRVANPTALDFETNPRLDVSISVTDEVRPGIYSETIVTVNLRDVNEAPTAVALQNSTSNLTETTDTTNRTKMADVVVADDFGGTNTLTLTGADAAAFEIDRDVLYLKAGIVLDRASKPRYVVTVNVDDASVGSSVDASTVFELNLSDSQPATLQQTNIDVEPSLHLGTTSLVVNDDATIAPFASLTFASPDTQDWLVRVTIWNGTNRGDFTPASTVGWSRIVDGNGITYRRFFPPRADLAATVESTLQGLVFQPRSNAITPNTSEWTDIDILVDDGVANSAVTSRITTISRNDAPALSQVRTTATISDNAPFNPFNMLTVEDRDHQELLVSVTILNGVFRGDFINATGSGWTIRQIRGNDITYMRYFNPTPNVGDAAEAAFRALTFQPRNNVIAPQTSELIDFQLTVSDGIAPPIVNRSTRTTTVSVNDSPTIEGTNSAVTLNDNAVVNPFSSLTVSDHDLQEMLISVTILNGIERGDFTNAAATGWTMRQIVGNDITYTRYLSPSPDVGASAEAAFRTLVFESRRNSIAPGTTESTGFRITVYDGVATAITNAETRVTTTSVNDAPTISGTSTGVTVNDDATINPFSTVTVNDRDDQEMLISATILNGVHRGDFINAIDSGWTVRQVVGNDIVYRRYFPPTANVGAAAEAAFRTLTFQPRNNSLTPGTTELTDFQITVSDGIAPAVANSNTRVTTISVNNAPLISGASSTVVVNDDSLLNPFRNLTVADRDTQEMLVSVTILNGVYRGDFMNASSSGWNVRQVLGNDIIYRRYFHPAGNIGAAAESALRALTFQPRNNAIRPLTTELTDFQVTVSDGVAPAIAHSGTRVTTTSVNNAPMIGGGTLNQTVSVNQTKTIFSTLTVTDADMQDLFVRITIMDGSNSGDFTPTSTTGWTRRVSGTDTLYEQYFPATANNSALVQAAIRALNFQPKKNVSVGTDKPTKFSVFISDGLVSVTDSTPSVITTGAASRAR